MISIVMEGDSAREAARLLNIGASTSIRWVERFTKTGSVEAKSGTGHVRSPLKRHEQWLLELITEEPDLTLEEIRSLWDAIDRAGSNHVCVIFRTASAHSPLESDALASLRNIWRRDEERSAIGFELDRSGIYGGFHCYLRR